MSLQSFAANGIEKINAPDIGIPQVDANTLLTNVLNQVYLWAGIIAVIVIIAAGYIYVTSAGNAQAIKKAKDAIFGAVIGLIVIMMAFTITAFVTGRF